MYCAEFDFSNESFETCNLETNNVCEESVTNSGTYSTGQNTLSLNRTGCGHITVACAPANCNQRACLTMTTMTLILSEMLEVSLG